MLVQDGQIVVLGGLLKDTYADNTQKVPVLGDVPVLGNLFKSQTRSRQKQNLMVFLRPVVLRDADQTDQLSMDRYELMRGQTIEAQPPHSIVTPINSGPVIPPAAGASQPAASEPARSAPAPLGR